MTPVSKDRSRTFRFSLILSFAVMPALAAQTIYVDAAAPLGGDGSSWTKAHRTLQAALAQAGPGREVWVAQGTYVGGFTIADQVAVRGGFVAGATRASQARPIALPSVLDGNNATRVLVLEGASVVEGFHVRNGAAPFPGGGGALVDGSRPTLRNCVFVANDNRAGRGAALSVINGGDPLVVNCLFYGNGAGGHTIDVDFGGRGTFDHVTVADNPHNGLHMQNGATSVITNCIFARNQGRGICDFANGAPNQPLLRNTLFWQNVVSLMHVRGVELRTIAAVNALAYARDNVAADPGFVASVPGDYRLGSNSGAIDTGAAGAAVVLDAHGNPRVLDGDLDGGLRTDIGFHEFSHVALSVSGTARPRNLLTFSLAGSPGLAAALLFSTPGVPVPVPPLGTFFGSPLLGVPMGALPGSIAVLVPAGAAGDLVAQGAAVTGVVGNASNVIELHVE